jgi:hypothetical protein
MMQRRSVTRLVPGILLLVVVAGAAALFATYWDDAWHTDLGRDDATIPPHLLLYGSVTVIGAVVVAWGLAALQRRRSLLAVLRQPPLLLAATGAAVTLAAAPIDAAWHAAFGRDAVLWSPPHLFGVFGTLVLIVGLAAGARPDTPSWILTGLGALLLGSAVVPVLEFETDVPQFAEVLYLPVLLAGALFAAAMLRALVPGPLPVVRAVGTYLLLRVAITAGLAGLGRSTPDLPLAILGLAAVDLPWPTATARYAAGAAGVALTTWLASALGLASVTAEAVAVVAVPALALFAAVPLAAARRVRPLGGAALILLLGVAAALWPRPAAAHDPGQGRPIAPVTLTTTSDGHGTLTITAEPADACGTLTPARVVARRAGQTITGALAATGRCRYAGTVSVPATGRWFLYVELRDAGHMVEAWLPVDAGRPGRLVQHRQLYQPTGRAEGAGPPTGEVVFGALLYAVGGLLLGLTVLQVRRLASPRHADATSA